MKNIVEQKRCLRREGFAKREQLSVQRRDEAARELMHFVKQTMPQGFVLSYVPFRSELDVRAINSWLAQENRLLLPKMQGADIVPIALPFTKIESLHSPKDLNQIKGEEIEAQQIAAALIPAIVFDQNKFRLGYGGGYYDRFLSKYPDIWTIGVGFKELLLANLPREEHDVPLDQLYLT